MLIKKLKVYCLRTVAIALAMVICSSFTVFADETLNEQPTTSTQTAVQKGWITENGNLKYILPDESVAKGWKTIDKKTYYFKSSGILAVGLTKLGKESFYFAKSGKAGERGALKTGWQKIGKYKYYFKPSGKLGVKGKRLKDCIAGTKKSGYAYVSDKGIKITSDEIKLAVKFVKKYSSSKKSKSKRLKECFMYIHKHYPYLRIFGIPNSKNISKKYAVQLLKKKRGNCFAYASGFSCIAKVLGYKVRFNEGNITTSAGGPDAHGWAEVKMGKKWYLFDISMHNRRGVNLYKKLKGQYPHKYKYNHRYLLKFKNNKAVWKKG